MHSVPCSLSARASAKVRLVNLFCNFRENLAPCLIVRPALLAGSAGLISEKRNDHRSRHAEEDTRMRSLTKTTTTGHSYDLSLVNVVIVLRITCLVSLTQRSRRINNVWWTDLKPVNAKKVK